MLTVQQRTATRLLRRALEAALPPGTTSGGLDALSERLRELPPRRDATLVLRETEAEREASFGRDRRRRYFDPVIHRFDPCVELFVFRRVLTSPWDEEWKKRPLVLRDVDLVHAFDFPPYLEAEPYDLTEAITSIIKNHPGPVDSLRVDSSVFPPPEILAEWMDALSAKGVTELVMLDVSAPPNVPAADFPVSRLRAPDLTTLALGFVRVDLSGCTWFTRLEAVTLTCCVCSGRDLSTAIRTLSALKSLQIFCCHLGAAGSGSIGTVEVQSYSLTSLEMVGCTASALKLSEAPKLCLLVAGVAVGDAPRRLVIEVSRADALQQIRDLHMDNHLFFLSAAKGSGFYKHRRVLALQNVHTLDVSVHLGLWDQATRLLELISQFPGLRVLTVKRLGGQSQQEQEDWFLQQAPACFHYSLCYLHIHGYRAAPADIGLVKRVLGTARSLVQVKLYADITLADPQYAVSLFSECRRVSRAACITCYV